MSSQIIKGFLAQITPQEPSSASSKNATLQVEYIAILNGIANRTMEYLPSNSNDVNVCQKVLDNEKTTLKTIVNGELVAVTKIDGKFTYYTKDNKNVVIEKTIIKTTTDEDFNKIQTEVPNPAFLAIHFSEPISGYSDIVNGKIVFSQTQEGLTKIINSRINKGTDMRTAVRNERQSHRTTTAIMPD